MSAPTVCWARDPHDGRLHACEPADVLVAASRGHTECLCGHHLPADVGLEDGPSGALCLPCVIGVTAEMDDPGCPAVEWDPLPGGRSASVWIHGAQVCTKK